MTPPSGHREIERKFRVADEFTIPDLAALGVVPQANPKPAFDMTAVYHDTESLSLFRWRTTLRRREGGPDEGWHLKLPVAGVDEGTRDEMHMPLSAGPIGVVPASLADVIAPLTRGDDLAPQLTVRSHRSPQLLCDSTGRPLLELVDDRVTAVNVDDVVISAFREIEVEVLDADDPAAHELLASVVQALIAAGAEPGSVSKAASALGPRAAEPADVPELPLPKEGGFAADLIRSTMSTHVRHFMLADVAVRRDLPDSVHQMRVAARRLRSVLKTFGPLIDPEWAGILREELGWIASELGAIRDTEVLMVRLEEDSALLGDPDADAASELIDRRLRQRLDVARSGALAALRSDRHTWLIEDLITATATPRLLDAAYQPVEAALPLLVHQAWRSLQKSVARLQIDGPADEWHRARIKAKQARYTVEAVAPVFGKRAARLARDLGEVTDVLGEHHDASVAQIVLRELAPAAEGPAAFALGRLHEVQVEREMLLRFTFRDLWPHVLRSARKSGLVSRGR